MVLSHHRSWSASRLATSGLLALVLSMLSVSVGTADIDRPAQQVDLAIQVEGMFAKYDRPASPGCAVGIVHDGRLVYSKGFGSANLDHEVANTTRTVFDTGSLAKSFTCACLAILLDQGRISPDDDIRKYLPELHAFDPPIRIRHVVRCRDGIWAQWHVQQLAGWSAEPIEAPYQEKDLLALLAGQETLPFEPGSQFQYGTGGYFLLGVLIERITGVPLAEFAKRNLFDPLEMSSTFFMDQPQQVVKHRATGYYRNDASAHSDSRWAGWTQNSAAPGGRSLFSCVEDLYRWDRNFSDNRLPAGKYMDHFIEHGTLLDNRNVLDATPTGQYRDLRRMQFTGGMPGFGAAITRFPDQRFSVICLSNCGSISPSSVASRIADLYLADELGPAPEPDDDAKNRLNDAVAELAEPELADKVGAFRLRDDGRIWRIVLESGKLRVIDHLNHSYPLTPMGNNRFRPEGGFFEESSRFVFERSSPAEPFSLTSKWHGGSTATDRVSLVEPNLAKLGQYVGRYRSDELSTTYRVKLDEGKLWLRVNNLGWETLDATVQDEFVPAVRQNHDNRRLRFTRDDSGEVVGLSVGLWRIGGIDFAKTP